MNKKVVFLPYDMDTALGINNEGALVFGYSLEYGDRDGDRMVYNDQIDLLNGDKMQSVLWVNMRDMFGDELKAMYQSLRSNGVLSYDAVETAFEEHQSKWPEAVFNEDAFFKYIQPLIDDNDETYLSMLLGSKTEQRKWWLYNRFKYIDSKYNCGDAQTDYIQLRAYAISNITLMPYADIYATIKWGSTLRSQRAFRNNAYVMTCPLDGVNDTEIYIYSASQLANVGDLSGLKVGFADFHNATKLRSLILGSSDVNYTNTNLRSVNVGNLRLLQKIDVRNCSGLGTYSDQRTVDLSGCSGIEEVYFDGTSVRGVSLPNGGFLKKLHLPGTITNLTIRNQTGITEFVCPDFSNVGTLNLENSLNYAQVAAIVSAITAGSRVRLTGYTWDFADVDAVHDFLDLFDGMIGLDQNGDNTPKAQLILTVRVPSATGDEIDSIIDRYPDITVEAETATYNLRYYNTEGTQLLYTETLGIHQNGSWNGTPSHAATAQYNYTFVGWSTMRNADSADINATRNITANRKVYAAYTKTVRTYTVRFLNDNNVVLATVQNVPYGGTATYSGSTPVHSSDPENMEFAGFLPTGANITGATDCIAQYNDLNPAFVRYLKRNLERYESLTATKIGRYAFIEMASLKEVVTSATLIEQGAFYNCTEIESVDLVSTSDITLNDDSFGTATKIKSLFIRSNSLPILSTNSLPAYIFSKLDGVLYVPSDMVNAYKATTPYSGFSNRVYPISDYPVTNVADITDSFAVIKAAVDDESFFSAGHALGETVQFTYGEHMVYAEIAKIDSTNKYIDFVLKNFDETIVATGSGTNVAYVNTQMKARLDAIYENELPSDLKIAISPVNKEYHRYNGVTETIEAYLWPLNTKDVNLTGDHLFESEGEAYTIFNTAEKRMKFNLNTGRIEIWMLGSANNSGYIFGINKNGLSSNFSLAAYGLIFGFRIQKSI